MVHGPQSSISMVKRAFVESKKQIYSELNKNKALEKLNPGENIEKNVLERYQWHSFVCVCPTVLCCVNIRVSVNCD